MKKWQKVAITVAVIAFVVILFGLLSGPAVIESLINAPLAWIQNLFGITGDDQLVIDITG